MTVGDLPPDSWPIQLGSLPHLGSSIQSTQRATSGIAAWTEILREDVTTARRSLWRKQKPEPFEMVVISSAGLLGSWLAGKDD